tara:strand:- start:27786 stop:28430 length:645 start_codon:yes stop_codon:yes gene_type:complete
MPNSASKPMSLLICDDDLPQEKFLQFEKAACLAVDTEAMGLIHGRDRLCLVQICDQDDNVACIRISLGQKSAPRLKKLMENNSIEKVFHFARFDVAALAANLKIQVNPIFCTKVASKIARTYSPRHGLKEVILELVGIELDKQAQSSDWGKVNELTEKQLTYAANDVRFLLPAKSELEKMLIRENRWDLAKRCFSCIPVMSELDRLKFINTFDH